MASVIRPVGLLSDLAAGARALRGAPTAVRLVAADVLCSGVYGMLTVMLLLVSRHVGATNIDDELRGAADTLTPGSIELIYVEMSRDREAIGALLEERGYVGFVSALKNRREVARRRSKPVRRGTRRRCC